MLHENAAKHYTCLSCYTVALIPQSADEIKAFCPICSPAKQVSYKRGIVLKPVPKTPEAPKAEVKVPVTPTK